MTGKAIVDAGICGFSADITAEALGVKETAQVYLETDCPYVKKLGEQFSIDIMDTLKHRYNSKFFKKVEAINPPIHFFCPVISGIYQTIKVAASIALPKDIAITLMKE
jgi:hypothetical protein